MKQTYNICNLLISHFFRNMFLFKITFMLNHVKSTFIEHQIAKQESESIKILCHFSVLIRYNENWQTIKKK